MTDITKEVKSIKIRLKDYNIYGSPTLREILGRHIDSLPNTTPEKKYLKEEYQLQCDMFDHGFISSSENL